MAKKTISIPDSMPTYDSLLLPTFNALKELGGSGSNDEILDQVIKDLNLSDEIVDFPHNGSTSQTELSYRLAWGRTYLRMFGAIENSARSVWAIRTDFVYDNTLSAKDIVQKVRQLHKKNPTPTSVPVPATDDTQTAVTNIELPEESEPW